MGKSTLATHVSSPTGSFAPRRAFCGWDFSPGERGHGLAAFPDMKIDALATPLVVVAEASESLATAARCMWAHETGALPVLDRGVLVGILSERHLVMAMVSV